MGLRAQLQAMVASCATGHSQCATFTESSATSNAAQELRVAFARPRNSQPSALTAHRVAIKLVDAAMKRCDEFNDGEAARQQMRKDCLSLSPKMQADLLAHLNGVPPWRA